MSVITRVALSAAALTAISLGVLPQAAPAAPANLVTNGEFESPALPYSTWALYSGIPGWTETAPGGCFIEIQNHVAGSPFEGQQFVELDSNCSSGIFQDLTTVAGRFYNVTYAFSARPGTGADDNILHASFGGVSLPDRTADGSALSDTSWTVYSQQVMATGSTTRLTFADAGISNGVGTYVDGVSVTSSQPATQTDCKSGGWQHYTDSNGTPFKNQGDCVSFVATQGTNLGNG